MHLFRRLLGTLLLLSLVISLQAQSAIPENVLFVGNSYTYFWNLPQTVGLLAKEKNIAMVTRQSTVGGATWGQHWRSDRGLKTINLIEQGNFDAIVIQDFSRSAVDTPDSLLYYGQLLGDLIKKKGAQAYVYMSWAREWDPYMQKPITEKYTELAEKINARIVPVGPAWQRARELRPGFPLYDEDGSHPSPLGTYLTACVFYGVFTQQSPVGLPSRIVTTDKDGETLFLSVQSAETALFCQKVAEEIIAQIKG